MNDREKLIEALNAWDLYVLEPMRAPSSEHIHAIIAAARFVRDAEVWVHDGNPSVVFKPGVWIFVGEEES